MGNSIRPVRNHDRSMNWDDPVNSRKRSLSDVMRNIGVEGIWMIRDKETGKYIIRWSIFRPFPLRIRNIERVVAMWLRSSERQLAGGTARGAPQTCETIANMTPNDGDERIKDLHHAFRRLTSSVQSTLLLDGTIEDWELTIGGRSEKGTISKTVEGAWDSLDRSSFIPLPFRRRLVSTDSSAVASFGA